MAYFRVLSMAQLGAASVPSSFFSDSSLAPGTSYCYRVAAANAQGSSPVSAADCTATDPDGNPLELRAESALPGFPLPDFVSFTDHGDGSYTAELRSAVSGTATVTAPLPGSMR